MSLLDGGTDTLSVTPEVVVTDARRNPGVRQPGNTSITVIGRLQPVSSEETAVAGQQVTTIYRFICRDFPAGPWAAITGTGQDWDVVGEPARHHGSERTRHVTVLLRARTPRSV